MKLTKFLKLTLFLSLNYLGINQISAQTWNPNHSIGSVNGNYNFSPSQVPSQLVEIYPAAFPNTGLSYQWESSSTPTHGFAPISGAVNSSYSFSLPLTQTTYFKRKTTYTSNNSSIYSNTIKISVVSNTWEDLNYVREHDVLITGVTSWQSVDNLAIGQKLQTTTYLDGLGRTTQRVSRETATPANQNNLWGDIVSFSAYDQYGRQQTQYLPYTTTTQSGKYKTIPLSEQPQYYTNTYNETSAFNTLSFDNSPLNRVKNVKESGTVWASSAGKSATYDLNTGADNVIIFETDYIQGNAPTQNYVYPSYGVYPANSLYKMTYTDENGKQVIEFSTKTGQLILKKVQLEDSPSGPYVGWICTYFIYDDLGLLRFQLQPEAVNYLANNGWSFGGTNGQQVLNEWCFQYNYDDKGRVIWKKAPGAVALNMIYDSRDRLVFTQDGNQAVLSTPQWTANLYDEWDRPVLTTLYNTTKTIATLKSDIANSASLNIISITSSSNNGGVSATSINASINPLTATELNNTATTTVTKIQFFDNYTFTRVKTFDNNFTNTTAYNTSDPNVYAIAKSTRTLNLPTGSLTRILGSNNFLATTNYFDERANLIQALEDNIKSGTDITTFQYHFDGRVLSTCNDHTISAAEYVNFKTLTKYLFDKLGRITSIQKSFGSNALKTISSYDYDDAGRIKTKHLDPGYTGNGGSELESLNYSFNLHGQITGINKDYALKTPGNYNKWSHFFGMYLGFDNRDNVFAQANLNGKVTGLLWNTQGDDAQRKYDYTYDNAGRLINAVFKEQQHPGDGWANNKMDFSVSGYTGKITYDLNSNLLSMLQKGVLPGNSAPITVDDLRYSYASYSNKLQSVTDLMTATTSNGLFSDFKDGSNGSNPDYVYDNNGNVVIDLNKNAKDLNNVSGANGIRYNFLDKPDQIRIAGKGTISIVYSGTGEKLQRIYTPETGTATTTTYVNQFIYQASGTNADALAYMNFEDGRIRVITPTAQNNGYDLLTVDGNMDLPNSKKGVYDYFIMDYQQNVRMILTEETHVAASTATMETSRSSVEEAIFGQTGASNEVATTRYAKPSGWTGNTSSSVSRLGNIAAKNIGPNTLQKVMAGDIINANVQYYYNQSASGNNSSFITNVLQNLVQTIATGPTSMAVKNNATSINNQLSIDNGFINAVQPSTNTGTIPLAYLTILFFDERFNLVSASDGGVYQEQVASSVGSDGAPLTLNGKKAPKNGYVYVYISNQSDQDVYFDDFKVTVAQGNIVEENHYYSFGLKISAISSKKIGDSYEGKLSNPYQYNDKEMLDEDADLNWYDYGFRNYDPQIGRFMQLDPLTDDYPFLTPYQYASNDPITNIDIDGLEGGSAVGKAMDFSYMAGTQAMDIGLQMALSMSIRTATAVGKGASVINGLIKTTGFIVKAAEAIKILSDAVETEAAGNGAANQRLSYWIFYNGQSVTIYEGEYGNKDKPFLTLKASSGSKGFQNSSERYKKSNKDNEPGGPIPEGEYSINLQARDPRQTANYPGGKLEGVTSGIQITYRKATNEWAPAWGRFRARLEPVKIDNPTGRNGFYIHDSYKGYSHGCIETETTIFYFLLWLHDAGVSNVKVMVKYPDYNSSTSGGTEKLDVKIPKNVKNPYVVPGPKGKDIPFKPSKDHPIIPIPKSPYTFQK